MREGDGRSREGDGQHEGEEEEEEGKVAMENNAFKKGAEGGSVRKEVRGKESRRVGTY